MTSKGKAICNTCKGSKKCDPPKVEKKEDEVD